VVEIVAEHEIIPVDALLQREPEADAVGVLVLCVRREVEVGRGVGRAAGQASVVLFGRAETHQHLVFPVYILRGLIEELE
jgi:hypothetical protein